MISLEPPDSKKVVGFIGDCSLVTQSARALSMFDWDVVTYGSAGAFREAGVEVAEERSLGELAQNESLTLVVSCQSKWRGVEALRVPVVLVSGCRFEATNGQTSDLCSEMLSYMRSGLGMMTRSRTEEGLQGTPFLPGGHLASFFAGLHVALIAESFAMVDLRDPTVVEVSAQECLLATLHNATGFAQLERRDVARDADPSHAGGRFACSDGEVLVSLPDAHHWESLLEILGNPDWAEGGWWRDATLRFTNKELLNGAIAAWCHVRTRTEILSTLQNAGIPAAFLASPADVGENPQLRARGYLSNPPHKVAFAHSASTASSRTAFAPNPISPLAGVRVCDLSWAWSGPYLTMSLAMLGAEVIKVENRTRLDIHRQQPPFVPGAEAAYERAAGHLLTNRGKLSLEADLKASADAELVRKLIASSELFVANFTPGVLETLGLGFDQVRSLIGERPFVYLTLTGFGSSGPWARYRSYGSHLAELSGLPAITGSQTTGPVNIAIPFADTLGGMYGAAAAIHFLREARRLNCAVNVDVSQFEVLVAAIRDGLAEGTPRGNVRPGDRSPTGVFRCIGSDAWLAVAIGTDAEESRLLSILGLSPSAQGAEVESALAVWASIRTTSEGEAELLAAAIPATGVLSAAELLGDSQLRKMGFWETHHVDGSTLLGPAAPWLVNGQRPPQLPLAPRVGEHTVRVKHMLSYSNHFTTH